MEMGVAEEIIDIVVPCQLSGYGTYREAKGYSNNLKVKVITFQTEKECIHVVSVDVLAIDKEIVEKIQAYFKEDKFLICGTHTHSSPAGLWQLHGTVLNGCSYFLGEKDELQISRVVEAVRRAVKQSKENLVQFSYQLFTQDISEVATNRDDPAKLGDCRCTAFKFLLEDGRTIGLVNFACHPTILDAKNTRIDGDIVAEIARQCQVKYDMVLFINGCAGDISTRYTKRMSSKKEVQRLAAILVKKLLDDRFYLPPKSLNIVALKKSFYTAELKNPKSKNSLIEWTEAERNYATHYEGVRKADIEINFLQIDDLCFVALPLELNSELANILKFTFSNVRFISYANGYMMYLPQKEAYEKHFYEAENTSFDKGEGEKVIGYICQELKKQNHCLGK